MNVRSFKYPSAKCPSVYHGCKMHWILIHLQCFFYYNPCFLLLETIDGNGLWISALKSLNVTVELFLMHMLVTRKWSLESSEQAHLLPLAFLMQLLMSVTFTHSTLMSGAITSPSRVMNRIDKELMISPVWDRLYTVRVHSRCLETSLNCVLFLY